MRGKRCSQRIVFLTAAALSFCQIRKMYQIYDDCKSLSTVYLQEAAVQRKMQFLNIIACNGQKRWYYKLIPICFHALSENIYGLSNFTL